MKTIWIDIAEQITAATGQAFSATSINAVGGGCINQSYHISDGTRAYFVKLNHGAHLDMFIAEAKGLNEIHASRSIRCPRPVCVGTTQGQAHIVMEYIGLGAPQSQSAQMLGEQLALMHAKTQSRFGLDHDNTIGSTPQSNSLTAEWVEFWQNHRLGFQLQLAAKRGYGGKLQRSGETLLTQLPAFFTDYQPKPALLHGDLWSGNAGYDLKGMPVIYDPALYYGDRECDLAMTELFGGFSSAFYDAYQAAYPLDPGYQARKTLYNLYHIINHLNLFGGGYQSQAQNMIEALLSQLR